MIFNSSNGIIVTTVFWHDAIWYPRFQGKKLITFQLYYISQLRGHWSFISSSSQWPYLDVGLLWRWIQQLCHAAIQRGSLVDWIIERLICKTHHAPLSRHRLQQAIKARTYRSCTTNNYNSACIYWIQILVTVKNQTTYREWLRTGNEMCTA